MNIADVFHKAFYEQKWVCAYRVLHDEGLPCREEKYKYKVIDVPSRYWIADPFLFEENGEVYVFCELMDRYKSKAVIGAKRIAPEEDRKINAIYEFDCHTSYPCMFKWKDDVYMTPETFDNHRLELLKCSKWPDKWESVGVLLEGMDIADCTPFTHNGKLYIFIYETPMGERKRSLYIGELNVERCAIENLHRAKEYDGNYGRPGGHNLYWNGKNIRIVQPGTKHYGEKIQFFEYDIQEKSYEEHLIGELLPEQIETNKKCEIIGVHTLNRCGNIEVVDLLIKECFHLFRPFMLIFQVFGIFGFDRGDKRKNYMNGHSPVQC